MAHFNATVNVTIACRGSSHLVNHYHASLIMPSLHPPSSLAASWSVMHTYSKYRFRHRRRRHWSQRLYHLLQHT
eukprot:11607213-Ditylum_brightwellii.AAC.1